MIGASGGVGGYAVQLAKALGAEVTGVSSHGKLHLIQFLGADRVVDYTGEDFASTRARRYDLILDIGGNPSLSRLQAALTPTGTVVIVGGEGGGAGGWAACRDRYGPGCCRRSSGSGSASSPASVVWNGSPSTSRRAPLRRAWTRRTGSTMRPRRCAS